MPRFLALAAHEDDAQVALDNPDLARYIENFGRAGDCAIVRLSRNTMRKLSASRGRDFGRLTIAVSLGLTNKRPK